jgi:Zn-dependent peptidase ImmA (M78 family)
MSHFSGRGIMFTYRTDEKLEEIGRSFLRQLGFEYQVRPDLMTMIMKMKHADQQFNYRRVPDEKMPNAEAHWYSDERELSMRESVFVGIQRGEARHRFTVAHEIAHYVLGHQGLLNRSTNQLHKDISAPLVKHQESEANRLAPIILAPEYLVPEGAIAEDIKRIFSLSAEASILRKEEVDRIRRRRRGELRPLPDSIKEFLREAKRQGFDIQTRLDD